MHFLFRQKKTPEKYDKYLKSSKVFVNSNSVAATDELSHSCAQGDGSSVFLQWSWRLVPTPKTCVTFARNQPLWGTNAQKQTPWWQCQQDEPQVTPVLTETQTFLLPVLGYTCSKTHHSPLWAPLSLLQVIRDPNRTNIRVKLSASVCSARVGVLITQSWKWERFSCVRAPLAWPAVSLRQPCCRCSSALSPTLCFN